MIKKIFIIFVTLLLCCSAAGDEPAQPTLNMASDISTTTTNFNNNLSSADTDVQKALETLDNVIGGGSGDVTDVWDCASGDCKTLTIGESEYLIGGAVDGTTDPYVSLPQGADVSSVIGEGRISWDTDNDKLYIGTGAAVKEIISTEADPTVNTSAEIQGILGVASSGVNGYLSGTDWDIFNGKESVLTFTSPLTRITNTIALAGMTGLGTANQLIGMDATAAFYEYKTLSAMETDPTALLTAGTDNVKDTHIDWGVGAGQVDLADIPGGISGANVWDFGGATSVKAPTVAGDLTLASGQFGIDTTQKQFGWHDGTRENAISSDKKITAIITAGDWDLDSDKWVWEFDSTIYPDGVVITKWTVDANVADPAVELNANLMYCDALANGAFPGATATLVDVLDTTTGNSTETNMALSDLGSGTIPAGKILYIDIDIDPATATDFFTVQIYFYQPES